MADENYNELFRMTSEETGDFSAPRGVITCLDLAAANLVKSILEDHYNSVRLTEPTNEYNNLFYRVYYNDGFNLRESNETNAMLDLMQYNNQFKDDPCVGSFWYDPSRGELFGVYSVLASDTPLVNSKLFNQKVKTGRKLHKDIWKKESFREKDRRFQGDHTLVPRGRVFQLEDGQFKVMVGDWIDRYPQAKDEILFEFQLPEDTEFVKDEHWNIGQGFSDEFLDEEYMVEKIVKQGSKWQVQSEKGRNMGTYDTKEAAKERLKQVEYFKHNNESLSESSINTLSKDNVDQLHEGDILVIGGEDYEITRIGYNHYNYNWAAETEYSDPETEMTISLESVNGMNKKKNIPASEFYGCEIKKINESLNEGVDDEPSFEEFLMSEYGMTLDEIEVEPEVETYYSEQYSNFLDHLYDLSDYDSDYDADHAAEWMERYPHGYYNNENDYGTGEDYHYVCYYEDDDAPGAQEGDAATLDDAIKMCDGYINKYNYDMAEIFGPTEATVATFYDGKWNKEYNESLDEDDNSVLNFEPEHDDQPDFHTWVAEQGVDIEDLDENPALEWDYRNKYNELFEESLIETIDESEDEPKYNCPVCNDEMTFIGYQGDLEEFMKLKGIKNPKTFDWDSLSDDEFDKFNLEFYRWLATKEDSRKSEFVSEDFATWLEKQGLEVDAIEDNPDLFDYYYNLFNKGVDLEESKHNDDSSSIKFANISEAYSPDDLNYYINKYAEDWGTDMAEVWEEVYNETFDEALADDVVAGVEEIRNNEGYFNEPDDYYESLRNLEPELKVITNKNPQGTPLGKGTGLGEELKEDVNDDAFIVYVGEGIKDEIKKQLTDALGKRYKNLTIDFDDTYNDGSRFRVRVELYNKYNFLAGRYFDTNYRSEYFDQEGEVSDFVNKIKYQIKHPDEVVESLNESGDEGEYYILAISDRMFGDYIKGPLTKEEATETAKMLRKGASKYFRERYLVYPKNRIPGRYKHLLDESLNESKNETLNPNLWENNELKPEVKEVLEKVVDKYKETLKEDNIDLDIKDVIIVGSNANYNFTPHSDIDLHIIADLSIYKDRKDLAELLYNAYRRLFNDKYTPTIKGTEVEIYVEPYEDEDKNNIPDSVEGVDESLNEDYFSPENIKIINQTEANKIIDNRKPLGLFLLRGKNVWVAIDNSTGDAWVEEFISEAEARNWLVNESLNKSVKPYEVYDDDLENDYKFSTEKEAIDFAKKLLSDGKTEKASVYYRWSNPNDDYSDTFSQLIWSEEDLKEPTYDELMAQAHDEAID